ncbi:MAG: polysaccharide deacetylase family protein [Roseococcus sp.]
MGMLDRLRRRWRGELAKRAARFPAVLRLDRPTLSVTFDDFHATSAETGAAVLEAAGVRGSFYVNGGTIGGMGELGPCGDAARLRALHAAGHEIGCHTFSHADLFRLDAAGIGAEMDRNAAWLAEQLGERPRSFAYPYGRTPLRAKRAAMARYRAVRGVQPGLNEGEIDLAYIRAAPLESARRDRELLSRLVEEAARRRAWLVLYAHDVQPEPGPYGVTPEDLDWVVRAALAAGCAVRPLGEVAAGP